jgi:glycerol-3-phosphate acyltransferase PlsX
MGSTRPTIAIDAMGGDFAPKEIVLGSVRATQELDVDVLLVGDEQQINAFLSDSDRQSPHIKVVATPEYIEMCEDPLPALKKKPQASINRVMELVKSGEADAVISAGHSGAAMAAALLKLGRIKGIDRPAIGAVLPTMVAGKSVIVLDAGANVDCKPKYLEQFALMGTIYSQYVRGVAKPKVGLVSIGEEESKGNDLVLKTHQLLKKNDLIPFTGNAEGRDILSGDFDVIVCDGFVGNVILKFTEAIGEFIIQVLREELPRGVNGKIGSALLKPNLKQIKKRIDKAEHGGALLLGVDGICLISHGSSHAPSIFNAIRMAKEAYDNQVLTKISSAYRGKTDVGS